MSDEGTAYADRATSPPNADPEADLDIGDGIDAMFELFDRAEALGWTDGLPILPATPAAVDRFLAILGVPAGDVIARLPPSNHALTYEKLAVCSVMAGCRPEYFPVVVAALEALADPTFELYGINTTTNPAAPMMIVNGPIRHEIGVNCGYGIMGPGWRANATIGRAVSLTMINVAGRIPGDVSKSTHGQPGRYTFCFGENEEESPYEPLHVERGFDRDESCVTVMAPSGTTDILDFKSHTSEGLLRTIAASTHAIGSANAIGNWGLGPMCIVLCPDHAKRLARSGLSKTDIREALTALTNRLIPLEVWPDEAQSALLQSGRVVDGFTPLVKQSNQWELVVAGGNTSLHDVFLPTYGDSFPVTRRIPSKLESG